jgi:hypothetical protein
MKLRLVLVVVLLFAVLSDGAGPARAGAALYPDLRTLRPTNLYFDRVVYADGSTHHVLRFANTVWNAGSGRLTLEGQKRSKIYQRVFDAPKGGNLVQRIYIGNDSIYHEGHEHYHLENFASYLLLKKDASGVYQATTKKGTKTSFCIMDTSRVSGSYSAQFTSCGRTYQGMTVGWGDTYGASLIDQWVDLGTSRLADGTYAVRSTADPLNKIAESNDGNNRASTCFTVRSGTISIITC